MSLDTQPPTLHLTPADLALPYAGGGGGHIHIKGAGMLVRNVWPLKTIILNFDYKNRVNKMNWKCIIF